MIRFSQVTKKYGSVQVLDSLNLEIEKGGVVAILGPNGSGKTTILKMILGMVLPDRGEVFFENRSISAGPAYRSGIGYLPQIAQFPDNLRVRELIRMIRDLRASKASESELLREFGLEPYLDYRLGGLSGGTKQKVNLVLTLMFDSPILILDEPTAGLDPKSMLRLKEIIRQERSKGKLIILTTHILGLVESLADEIVFLLDGSVCFRGTLEELELRTGSSDLEVSIAKMLE